MRAARAEVDLGAIAHNVATLVEVAAPARVCAVVKADGYGHGAIAVSEAALSAGASWLGVALVEEGAVLRKSEITAPILLLSQARPSDLLPALRYDLRLTVYTPEGVEAAGSAAAKLGVQARLHLKVDTGMNRVGCRPADALALARAIDDHPHLELEAVWTHCAAADEPGEFTDEQLEVFTSVVAELDEAGLHPPLLHAANSAATIDHSSARFDLARVGIAIYGLAPSPTLADRLPLRPAMTLRAEVSMVKRVPAGESISYGRRHFTERETTIATVPIGYADGVPRRLAAAGGEVLVGGRRRPIVGVVTMDQLMVDVGDDEVSAGDEVVLIGAQGDEQVTADEWAGLLGTINYEVVCAIGPRVPRTYVRP